MENLVVNYKFDLKSNMEELKSNIAETIEKYDIVVTNDTVKETKKLMADINKQKTEFKTSCKGFLDEVSAPINAFKEQQKEIEALYDNARSKLETQVKSFEHGVLDLAKDLLEEYILEITAEKELNKNLIEYRDLILLGTVSASGKLASGAKEKIDARVLALELEIAKAKAKAEEQAKRDREIAEKARQEAEEIARQREVQMRIDADERLKQAERRAELAKQQAVADTEERVKKAETLAKIPEKKETEKGKKIINIRIDIQVEVGTAVAEQSVIDRIFAILPDSIKEKNPKIYTVGN